MNKMRAYHAEEQWINRTCGMYLEHRRSGANTYLRLMQSECDTKSGVR